MNATSEELKKLVKEKYGEIATQTSPTNSCGINGCCGTDYTQFSDDYSHLEGYNPDADLSLGCGIPTEFARIKSGDTVIDLGSGTGNDCFVARALVGDTGKVIGIDMTDAMIQKARENVAKLGYINVEFRLGDIEKMPVTANKADVIISNCVLNLVPDKEKAFQEIFRVLKPGGHFSVSDIVLDGELPLNLKSAAEMYAGCVSGAIQMEDYLDIIENAGFKNIDIQKMKVIKIPDEILQNYLSSTDLEKFRQSETGIMSITVFAQKPAEMCCSGNCNC